MPVDMLEVTRLIDAFSTAYSLHKSAVSKYAEASSAFFLAAFRAEIEYNMMRHSGAAFLVARVNFETTRDANNAAVQEIEKERATLNTQIHISLQGRANATGRHKQRTIDQHSETITAASIRRNDLLSRIAELNEATESAKRAHEEATTTYGTKKADFKSAKYACEKHLAEMAEAEEQFESTGTVLESVSAEMLQYATATRNADDMEIARGVGVPTNHLDNFWVFSAPDGGYEIFYGGEGTPDGPGHIFCKADSDWILTCHKDPHPPALSGHLVEN